MTNEFWSIIAMAPSGTNQGSPPIWASPLFMLLIMFAIFYLLIIRPQKKREEERRRMLESLKKNDRVVTTGGIHGQIMAVRGDEVIIRIDHNKDVRVKFNRSAVSRVISRAEGQVEGEEQQ